MFLFFVTSIGSVMLPRITNVFSKNDESSMKYYLNNTFSLSLYLSIPMIFGIFAVVDDFVAWFLPPTFYSVAFLIKCISPIILFISLSNVYGIQYLVPTGKTNYYTYSVIAGAITNFIVNFILIPSLGAVGASIGSVFAELVVTAIQYHFTKKTLKLRIENIELFKIIISSAVMFILIYFLKINKSPSVINTLIQIGFGIFTYFGMLFILKAQFFVVILASLKKYR